MQRDYDVTHHVGGFAMPLPPVHVVCGVAAIAHLVTTYLTTVPSSTSLVCAPLVVLDVPVGFALQQLDQVPPGSVPRIVVTHNCCPEYLDDLWERHPAILLAGDHVLADLGPALDRAAQGARYRVTPGPPSGLTLNERALLHKVAHGWSAKQIATAHGLQPKTVSNQITALCAKLHLHDRVAATLYYWGRANLLP